MIAGLRRQLDEMRYEAECLRRGRYPSFVVARSPDPAREDVPVFVFHTIESGEFEEQLRYLTDNGYHTLDGAAFHAHLTGTGKIPPRSVLLTIDDGRASVWNSRPAALEEIWPEGGGVPDSGLHSRIRRRWHRRSRTSGRGRSGWTDCPTAIRS